MIGVFIFIALLLWALAGTVAGMASVSLIWEQSKHWKPPVVVAGGPLSLVYVIYLYFSRLRVS